MRDGGVSLDPRARGDLTRDDMNHLDQQGAGTTTRSGMNHFGQHLRAERERQSLQLAQVSASIRVREQYIDAIERHDWEALPEPVFTRGYIQSYAQHLHMDPNLVLNAYAREMRISRAGKPPTQQAEEETTKALLERLARTQGLDLSDSWWRNRWMAAAVMVIAACAIAAALGFIPTPTAAP